MTPSKAGTQAHSQPASNVSNTLRSLNLNPSKGKGQNFLIDSSVADRIIDLVTASDDSTIVEIGPGLGALTERLAARHDHVVAVEFDRTLAAHLQDRSFEFGFEVIEGDALTLPVDEILPRDRPYAIVANLPYSVGTPIVRRFLEESHAPDQMVVMLQREVAERMTASPPNMSVLGIATQLYSNAEMRFDVGAEAFKPRPKVKSAVIELRPRPSLSISREDREGFFRLVNAGFAQKRKTLANSLSRTLDEPKPDVVRQLESTGIDASLRAQMLALEDWVTLFEMRKSQNT